MKTSERIEATKPFRLTISLWVRPLPLHPGALDFNVFHPLQPLPPFQAHSEIKTSSPLAHDGDVNTKGNQKLSPDRS